MVQQRSLCAFHDDVFIGSDGISYDFIGRPDVRSYLVCPVFGLFQDLVDIDGFATVDLGDELVFELDYRR